MRRRIAGLVAVVAALTVVVVLVLGAGEGGRALEASGTVEAVEADLGFNLPGRIVAIEVREGDRVAAGQVLARLEAAELEARRAAAHAQLEAARSVLAEMEAGARAEEVAQGRAALRAAARRVEDARLELDRARTLHEGGAIPRQALDRAETAFQVAEADLDQARERLALIEAGPRPERLAAQRAAVASAEAAVREVEARLANAVVTASFSGRVSVRHREPGESVQPGQPVITLLDPNDRWVQIYVREDRIGTVAIGQPAAILSDSDPETAHRGVVSFIAGEAEFTPRNVQTREDRVKLVYGVRVRVTGDPEHVLKPGVPADVVLLGDDAASPLDG